MSTTGLAHFDDTVHKTNVWLKEVMIAFEWEDRQTAYRALRVTLHTIRDHLPVAIIAHLSAQVPTLVRGVLFEGWTPETSVHPDRSLSDFLHPIQQAFDRDIYPEPETIAQRVFGVIANHVSEGEISHIEQALPKHVRDIVKTR